MGTKAVDRDFPNLQVGWTAPETGTQGDFAEFRVWNRARTATEIRSTFDQRRSRLALQAGRLESLSPLGVLARGYALVRRVRDELIVRRAAEAPPGERLRVRVAEGEILAVSNIRQIRDGEIVRTILRPDSAAGGRPLSARLDRG